MAPRTEDELEDGDMETKGAWAQGLSKGVFAHKRSTKRSCTQSPRKKTKKRRMETESTSGGGTDQYLQQCFASKQPKWSRERVEVHDQLVAEVEERVDRIQTQIFKGVYDSLVSFVQASQKLKQTTIPTAVLLTGVNMPDHARVFGHLVDRLKTITPHISLLSAGQTLKQLVASLVLDLTNTQEDEEITIVKKSEASFGFLVEWYSNQYCGADKPPLVLVFQDFENCGGGYLNDIITLISRYLSSLPFILVLGVATTLSTLHKTLPQSTTAKLTINTFGSPNASLHLEEVIESVLMDPEVPFKLSGKVFQFLLENFLFHDFSIKQFLSGYRFILGEHLYRNPAALLMCGEEKALSLLQRMDLEDFSYICRLQSFRDYLSTLEVEEQAENLVNVDVCRNTIQTLIKEYLEYVRTFSSMVKALYYLGRDLPRRPLGRLLRDVYLLALNGGIETTSQYREAFQFLKLSNRPDLETKLNLVLHETEDRPLLATFSTKIRDFLHKFSQLETEGEPSSGSPAIQSLPARFFSSASSSPLVLPSSLDTDIKSLPDSSSNTTLQSCTNTPLPCSTNTPLPSSTNTPLPNSTDTPLPSSTNTPLPSSTNTPEGSAVNSPAVGRPGIKLDRYRLQASLLDAAQKNIKSQLLRPFDRLRGELMGVLHEALKERLVPPSARPLHEIFLFTNTGTVRRHLAGAPRAALHTALTDPFLYLEHPDLQITDSGEIPASLPDICVGYKLHLECPRLINVFDWLSCWHSILGGGAETITQEDQARFTRVVAELNHLGFIKTSNRKTDHVARLTFGGS